MSYDEAVAYSASVGETWANDMAGWKLCHCKGIPCPVCVHLIPVGTEGREECAWFFNLICGLPIPVYSVGGPSSALLLLLLPLCTKTCR